MIPINYDNLRDCVIACLIAAGVWGLVRLFPGGTVVAGRAQQTTVAKVAHCAVELARVGGCVASSDQP